MQDKQTVKPTVWIAGGNGFVGHELAYTLIAQDYPVCLFSRSSTMHTDFKIVGTDYSAEDLAIHLNSDDTVINLIGILNEKGFNGKGFEKAHVDTTKSIIDACGRAKVKRYLHMSALHACLRGPSHYLMSKARAENAVENSDLDYTIFRPSVIFGRHDSFTNRFAQLLKLSPFVFPLACAQSRFQPIFVGDVAACFVQSLQIPQTIEKSYDLCGPETFNLIQIVELIANTLNKKLKIIPLSHTLSKLQAMTLQFVPGKPFSMDNFKSLQIDSVCTSKQPLPFELSHTKLSEEIKKYLGA